MNEYFGKMDLILLQKESIKNCLDNFLFAEILLENLYK